MTIGSAATEGIGLVLLVPIVAVLSNTSALPSSLGNFASLLGGKDSLGPLLLAFVVLIGLRALLNFYRAMAALTVQRNLIDGLRIRAWHALLHCDWRVLSGMRQSDNASLLITTLDRVGVGIDRSVSGGVAVITLLGVGAAAVAISPVMTVCALIGGGAVLYSFRRLRLRARMLGGELNDVYERIYAELGEGLAALRIIKSFGAERATEQRLRRELASLHSAERTYTRENGLGQVALQVGSAGLLALVVWLALQFWKADLVVLLPMIALFARGFPLLMAIQGCLQDIAYARPSIDSALSLIERAEAAREPDLPADATVPSAHHSIGLRDVSLTYAGRQVPALDAVNINLPVQQITALLGPSGAGKSTLADVIGGLLRPDSGVLLIDGEPVDFSLRRAWRTRVTYVQQVPILFTGTVRDNLLWAQPHADDTELYAALREASAHFIERMPDGLDTLVGENGHQFSGGERQRLILARAMMRVPQLLILDEAANALDPENDRAIAQAVLRLRGRCAILVIAHGGALESIADQTVRLELGRIDRG
nr:ABC transporter ATP-binding protein [Novosphingobium hassiacum]